MHDNWSFAIWWLSKKSIYSLYVYQVRIFELLLVIKAKFLFDKESKE